MKLHNTMTFKRLGYTITITAAPGGQLTGTETDKFGNLRWLTCEDCLVLMLEHFGNLSTKTMRAVLRETHPVVKIA
jgi:hypothetical protein